MRRRCTPRSGPASGLHDRQHRFGGTRRGFNDGIRGRRSSTSSCCGITSSITRRGAGTAAASSGDDATTASDCARRAGRGRPVRAVCAARLATTSLALLAGSGNGRSMASHAMGAATSPATGRAAGCTGRTIGDAAATVSCSSSTRSSHAIAVANCAVRAHDGARVVTLTSARRRRCSRLSRGERSSGTVVAT